MKKLSFKSLLLGAVILFVMLLAAFPALADSYASRVDAFLKDNRWKNGVNWPQRFPKEAPYVNEGNNQYPLGCAAYAADFAYKTWASHPYVASSYKAGIFFNQPSDIRDGDVIVIYNWAKNSDGNFYKDTHFYCVIQRKADGSLYTAEGAFSDKVRIIDGAYSVSNPFDSSGKTYFEGYHNPDYEPYETIPIGQPMQKGYDRAIADGDYLIVTAATTDKSSFYYVDIQGTDVQAASGTNVSLCGPYVDVPAHEVWTVTYGEGFGFYNIKQKGTNISLTVQDASLYAGTNVLASTHTASNSQHWAISRSDNGYTIQSECNGFALDIKGGDISKGANIQVFTCNGGNNQSWLFIPYQPTQPLSEGRYILVSSADEGKIVDVPGITASVSEGTALQINSDGVQNQYNSFDFKKLSNGYYTIIHAGSGKALGVYGGVPDKNAGITLRTPNNSTSQQWRVKSEGNGAYSLTVRSSGFYMNHASTDNGTPIVQWYYNGLTTQKWLLVKAEHTVKYNLNGGSGAQSSQTKYYKNDLKLSEVRPAREGYMFTQWNTRPDGSGTGYQCGDTYAEDDDMTLYAQWRPMSRLVLSAGLDTIDEEAFANIGANSIVVPEGCKTIGKRAFADNNNLEQISIPASVKSISFDAFENCPKLTIYSKAGSEAIKLAEAIGIPYRIVE